MHRHRARCPREGLARSGVAEECVAHQVSRASPRIRARRFPIVSAVSPDHQLTKPRNAGRRLVVRHETRPPSQGLERPSVRTFRPNVLECALLKPGHTPIWRFDVRRFFRRQPAQVPWYDIPAYIYVEFGQFRSERASDTEVWIISRVVIRVEPLCGSWICRADPCARPCQSDR